MPRRIPSEADRAGPVGAPPESGAARWAPHGWAVTAAAVALNVLLILILFYLLFRRFFAPKRIANNGSSSAPSSSSAETSPSSSPRRSSSSSSRSRNELPPLPIFVHRPAADGVEGDADDCAVCLAGFRDGQIGRVLPRCGHRFHAQCVDAWLRLRGACPLCRTAVTAAAAADQEGSRLGSSDEL